MTMVGPSDVWLGIALDVNQWNTAWALMFVFFWVVD